MNQKDYRAGAIAGIAGGILFGLVLSSMNLFPAVAGLVGSSSVLAGVVAHLVLSLLIGLVYVWWFGSATVSYGSGAGYGLLYGFIWWILGSLIIFPLVLGMGIQIQSAFSSTSFVLLLGHLLYGLTVGIVYAYVTVERTHMIGHQH